MKKYRKLDEVFSKYIRTRYSNNGFVKCWTCGKVDEIKRMHCGHFMSRRHLATRWEEKNCGPQCPSCNTFNQGRQFEMSKAIDAHWGEGTADKMLIKSRNLWKPSKFDIDLLYNEYKHKYEEL